MAGLGDDVGHGSLSRLAQDSGGLASFVAVDVAALRIAAGQVDAAELQGARVGDSDVAVDAHQKYGMTIGNFIEIPARGRDFNRPESFIPAGADDPLTGLGVFDSFREALAQFVERLHAGHVDAHLGAAAIVEMQVRVVESGHDEVSVEIDDLRLRAFESENVDTFADGLDAVAANGNGFLAVDGGERSVVGHAGVDVGVGKDDVGAGASVLRGAGENRGGLGFLRLLRGTFHRNGHDVRR